MTDEVFKLLHKENLCTYFILPLLKLNKQSYTGDINFVDSYLTYDLTALLVEVKEITFIQNRLPSHANFKNVQRVARGHYFIQYEIPTAWKKDVALFAEGKFSHMSSKAKEAIIAYSGLQYRERDPKTQVPFTDIRLLALNRSSDVRAIWEEKFDTALEDDAELLSKPDERSFKDLKELISV